MGKTELAYLMKCRELSAKQDRINGLIASLRKVCESLSNWRETAYQLCSPGSQGGWSDGSLRELSTLRSELIQYHGLSVEASKLWDSLTPDEKTGLANPESLEAKK